MTNKGVEEIVKIFIEKTLIEEYKDEALVGLSILLKEEFYGNEQQPAMFIKMMNIFIHLVKIEKKTRLKDFAISCLITLIESWSWCYSK